MSKNEKERRCKSCGKLLLDEKFPYCRRCELEARNKVGQAGSIVGSFAITALGGVAHVKNNSGGKKV